MQINATRSMRHIALLRFANDVRESGREGMIERFLRLNFDFFPAHGDAPAGLTRSR
ncbi:hypothetical protein [Pandoraea pneumonica]|uniref:hypothetical protein n=1 Tax=Pandoraea pneumonica TaxID=2508299 RepID=UPI00158405AA|nr:hypothetical protein [Pandoraea pneumonica]